MKVLLLCCMFVIVASQGTPDDEEFVLNFDSPVYVCSDDSSKEFIDSSDITVSRFNETTSYMSGVLRMLKTLEPCAVVEMIVEKTTGSRTEVMVTHDICDLCAEVRPESDYFKYLRFFEFPSECPFQPGDFKVLNFVVDSEDLPVNKANEARYQVTFNFYENSSCDCKDKTFLGCVKADFVIEPL
ncbi:hypothetical protein ACJJTC_014096 [Scirpophaga incertulas]